MNTSLENSPNLTFINLKEYISDYFTKYPFIFLCENPELITTNNKFNSGTVSLTNHELEQNIRFEDSCYPEYLYTLLVHSEQGSLLENIKMLKPKLKNISYHQSLFQYKLKQLFEIILFKDFYKTNWPSNFIKDRCYVIKVNSQLEYYTIWDYLKLLNNLLNWIGIERTELTISNQKAYQLSFIFIKSITVL